MTAKKCIVAFLTALAGILSLSSCTRPASTEDYLGLSGKGTDGYYHFTVDMSDSLSTYDFWLYSRIDCNHVRLSSLRDFPMEVTWVSPDSTKYREKVYFSVHDSVEGSDFYSNQYRLPYRLGVVPVKNGIWEMMVKIDADEHFPGFRGIGLVCEKKDI